jgi:hypothetical protein
MTNSYSIIGKSFECSESELPRRRDRDAVAVGVRQGFHQLVPELVRPLVFFTWPSLPVEVDIQIMWMLSPPVCG